MNIEAKCILVDTRKEGPDTQTHTNTGVCMYRIAMELKT